MNKSMWPEVEQDQAQKEIKLDLEGDLTKSLSEPQAAVGVFYLCIKTLKYGAEEFRDKLVRPPPVRRDRAHADCPWLRIISAVLISSADTHRVTRRQPLTTFQCLSKGKV